MEQENDQLNEQGANPYNEKEGLQDAHQSGQEIRDGARNEDQLDKIKASVPKGGRDAYPEQQAGTPPNTYLSSEENPEE
ncbi:hypothetical protein ABDD95_04345 [Mucilaginibacter sp. PAMB04274]|uniref:hypothetical protein n=1 Tax=Mucilaginibacter sp. PAMB04274 TaxID=3138568 RepID=UPI0031F6C4EA